MNHAFDVTGPHFSAAYLVNNADGIIRRVRRAGLKGFTITHHGKALVYAQLLPAATPTVEPSHAAPRVPPVSPDDDALAAFLARYEPNDDDDDDDIRADAANSMQASEPAAT